MIKIENIEVSGFEAAFRGLRNPMNSWDRSDSYFGISSEPYNDFDYEVCAAYVNKEFPELEEHSQNWEAYWEEYNNWLLDNGVLKRDTETGAIQYAYIGPNDMDLAQRMIKAGDDEGKFMRMIHIQMDITAPLYWWKEADTYKVGTVANSCSTMHKIAAKEFTLEDFSHEHLFDDYSLEDQLTYGCSDTEDDDFCYTSKDALQIICDILNHHRFMYLETKDKRYWWQMIQLLPSSYNQKRTVDFNYQTARHMYFARRNHKLDEWHTFTDKLLELPYGKELIGVEK